MLHSLHISNYALIDVMDICFHDGFNVITGETGAGKSILMSALGLLLGGRADLRVVTDPERRSVIEAVFGFGQGSAPERFCRENDIDWDASGRLILRREISAGTNGRSRAFVNDSPVAVGVLSQLGLLLIDIHSQHQNQLLAKPSFQLDVVDNISESRTLLEDYVAKYRALRQALRTLKQTKTRIEEARRNEDLLRYRLEKLSALDLRNGELSELENERHVLSNLTQVKEALNEMLGCLGTAYSASGQPNALELVQRALRAVDVAQPALPEEDNIAERLRSAYIELEDINSTLTRIDQSLAAEPGRLEYVESRLNAVNSALMANDVKTDTELIALRHDIERQLADIEDGSNVLEQVRAVARAAKQEAEEAAARLSEARREGARRLEEALRQKASPLGMKNLVADISLTACDLSPTGADEVDFRFAFNKNQQPMSIGNTASGGEVSRLMLATKALLAESMSLPTIIFDEIDTGVSGEIAGRMGLLMREISKTTQVVAITHLPQVAALADAHFRVFKSDDEVATHSRIASLNAQGRVEEIASMLSADRVTDAARTNARHLLFGDDNN